MRNDRLLFRPARLGLAVLLALSASVAAQSHDPKSPEKHASHPAASTPAAPAGDTNTLAVTGLTPANTAAAKSALEGLSHTVWRCPACSMTEAEQGTCPMCQKELVSEKSPALRNITMDGTKGTIGFALAPGQAVRLTELEAVLSAEKISIPRDKLALGSSSTLLVNGASSEDSIKKVEAELKSSKLFDSVTGRLVGSGKPAELTVKSGATPATRARVEAALAQAGPEFKLVDVIWSAPMAAGHGATPKSHG